MSIDISLKIKKRNQLRLKSYYNINLFLKLRQQICRKIHHTSENYFKKASSVKESLGC